MPPRNPPILCDEKDANRYVSRVIPWVLLAIVVYASYAVTKPLCSKQSIQVDKNLFVLSFLINGLSVDYLIHPQSHYNREPRIGAGVAIIVVFYVLLFPAITAYLRLYFVVMYSPDYLPRGANWVPPEPDNRTWASRRRNRKKRKSGPENGDVENNQEKPQRSAAESTDIECQTGGVAFPLGEAALESFWMKDIFVCQDDGRPAYCSKCCQFKTDRSHHNRDVDRCVRKLDHFCPWVGGVVSESSYKFFLQFVVYTAIFTCFGLIVFAYFIAERRSEVRFFLLPFFCMTTDVFSHRPAV
jgi:palmitoyltransferase